MLLRVEYACASDGIVSYEWNQGGQRDQHYTNREVFRSVMKLLLDDIFVYHKAWYAIARLLISVNVLVRNITFVSGLLNRDHVLCIIIFFHVRVLFVSKEVIDKAESNLSWFYVTVNLLLLAAFK